MTKEQLRQKHEENLKKLKAFRLMDDDFMTACFDGQPECVELILQIIMSKPDLKVIDVKVQCFIKNLLKRSVKLDIFATDGIGKKYNIEIQREDKGAGSIFCLPLPFIKTYLEKSNSFSHFSLHLRRVGLE